MLGYYSPTNASLLCGCTHTHTHTHTQRAHGSDVIGDALSALLRHSRLLPPRNAPQFFQLRFLLLLRCCVVSVSLCFCRFVVLWLMMIASPSSVLVSPSLHLSTFRSVASDQSRRAESRRVRHAAAASARKSNRCIVRCCEFVVLLLLCCFDLRESVIDLFSVSLTLQRQKRNRNLTGRACGRAVGCVRRCARSVSHDAVQVSTD
jgi:hypothetical protein